MKRLSGSIVALGLFLGVSVQAGPGFDNLPGNSSYPPKKVLFDLAKKCQVNPATAPDGWVNMATSHGAFHQAVQALKNDDEPSYRATLNKLSCPVNQNGVWMIH